MFKIIRSLEINTYKLVKLSCDVEKILINLQLGQKTFQTHLLHIQKSAKTRLGEKTYEFIIFDLRPDHGLVDP